MHQQEDSDLTKATSDLARSISHLSNVLALGLKLEQDKDKQATTPSVPPPHPSRPE